MEKQPEDAADPGPVPPGTGELFPAAPKMITREIPISQSRSVIVRGFADKPRVDLVLKTGGHEAPFGTLNVSDGYNIGWLLQRTCKELMEAHEQWSRENRPAVES